MKVLVIYAHPYDKSFNREVLNTVENLLNVEKIDYYIIDLYKNKFNPIYSTEELALFKYGKTTDEQVNKYQKVLKEADKLIFIFPIWWNETPAIIKGFIDKVMKKRFAYDVGKFGMTGHLKNITTGWVFTTSTSPTWYLRLCCGNAIEKVFINSTLFQLGIKNVKWCNFGRIDKSNLNKRKKYLDILYRNLKKGLLNE